MLISVDLPPEIKTTASKKKMIGIRTEGNKTFVEINYSSMHLIQTCPTKAHLQLGRGLKSRHESPATAFGTAIHKALETFYLAPRDERRLPRNMMKNLELLGFGTPPETDKDFLIYRAARDFIDSAEPLAPLPPEDKRSIQTGLWILGHYFQTHVDDPYSVYMGPDGPMVENMLKAVVYDSSDLQIEVFGTIDVILENQASGQILVADHKTSSVVGKDFYNRLKPNHQYTCYLWLAQTVLGLETDKFMVNCLQVKPKPKTARGGPPNFPRQITTRSEEDINAFKADVVYWVRRYLNFIETDHYPMGSVDACTTYGGCTYLPVCSAPNGIKENIIQAEYIGDSYG